MGQPLKSNDLRDPAVMIRQRQHVRIEEIIAMLRRHGFEEQNRRGSHRIFANEEFNINIMLADNPDEPEIARKASKACLLVRNLKKQKAAATASTDEPPQAGLDYQEVTITADLLPSSIEIVPLEDFDDSVILRSNEFPQIGEITAKTVQNYELQGMISQIENRTRSLRCALGKTLQHNFTVCADPLTRALHITTPLTAEPIIFPPHSLTSDPEIQIEEEIRFLTKSFALINKGATNVYDYLNAKLKSGEAQYETRPDGSAEWKIRHACRASGERKVLALVINNHPTDDLLQYTQHLDDVFESDFGKPGESDYLETILKRRYGMRCERRVDEDPDSLQVETILIFTHPYFPEFQFEIPDPSELKTLKQLDDLYDPDTEDTEIEVGRITSMSNALHTKRITCCNQIAAGLKSFENIRRESHQILERTYKTVYDNHAFGWRNGEDRVLPGEEDLMVFEHADFTAPVTLRCIRTTITPWTSTIIKNQYQILGHPEDIRNLDREVRKVTTPASAPQPVTAPATNQNNILSSPYAYSLNSLTYSFSTLPTQKPASSRIGRSVHHILEQHHATMLTNMHGANDATLIKFLEEYEPKIQH